MAQMLHSDQFRECLHTNFELTSPTGEPVPLVLMEVQEAIHTARVESFSLFFRGPLTPFFQQATYSLQHEKLGPLDMFLVPLGPDGDRMQYEAVFNRLRDRK